MKLFLAILAFLINNAHAAFIINTMSAYSTSSDSKTSSSTSSTSNHFFIGASIGAKQHMFVGQNITIATQEIKTATTNKLAMTELGPRLVYYFDDGNVFYSTLSWNPYAKGTRTINGVSEDISGFSYFIGVGAELKINHNFHIGGSLNYKSLSISKAISTSLVASTVSNTYASIDPMINLSFRFR